MSDRKTKWKTARKVIANDEMRKSRNIEELEMFSKVEALSAMFSQSKDQAEEFHVIYVQPLLDAGVGLETALELVIAGVIRPN